MVAYCSFETYTYTKPSMVHIVCQLTVPNTPAEPSLAVVQQFKTHIALNNNGYRWQKACITSLRTCGLSALAKSVADSSRVSEATFVWTIV